METIWVSEEHLAAAPYKPTDIIVPSEFPVFKKLPADGREQKEARWKATYQDISRAQRECVKMKVLYAFNEVLDACRHVDTETKYQLETKLCAVCDDLSVASPQVQTRFTTYQLEACIEVTFQFMIGSSHHALHVCNLSPSEYARLR
jgi:hypothetical protein